MCDGGSEGQYLLNEAMVEAVGREASFEAKDKEIAKGILSRYENNNLLWITLDNRKFTLEAMTSTHIVNCIAMLNRAKSSRKNKAWISVFCKELLKRENDKFS